MKKRYLLSACLGLLLSTPIFAQSNLGIGYLFTGETKLAREVFEKQVSQSPGEAYYFLGEIAAQEGNQAEAKANYEKGLSAAPEYALNNVGLGKLLLKSNSKEAETLFSEALKKNKKDVNVLVAIAAAYYANNDAAKGDKYIADARKADKKAPLIYIVEGDMKAKSNVGEASGSYAQAINFDPNYMVAYVRTAQVYETVNPDYSVEMLQKALTINPNYTIAYRYLGRIFSNQGRFNDAIDSYKKYFSAGTYDVDDLKGYAGALYFTKQYDEAKKLINEGISKDPNNFVLNRLLMYSYLQSKDYTNGLATADKFFALDKGTSEYIVLDYMTYGELLTQNGQADKALVQYEKAVQLDPSKADIYKDIALTCANDKQYAKAAEYYQQYISKANPDLLEATDFFKMGQNYYFAGVKAKADGNEADAKTLLKKADDAFVIVCERLPERYIGYQWRGNVGSVLDPEALEGLSKPHFDKVISILEGTPGSNQTELSGAYRYMMFYYYQKYSKSNDAAEKAQSIAYAEKVLTLDPANQGALDLIKALK